MEEAIQHLRQALQRMVEEFPCIKIHPECHCSTCEAEHALSATSGFAEKEK